MQIVPLPPPTELEKLLGALLGRPVKAAKAPAGERVAGPQAVALFVSGEPVLEMLVRSDLPLADSLAASLSVVPVTVVREAIASGRMEQGLQENLAEVLNVLARFLSGSGRPFRLGPIAFPPEPFAADKLTLAEASDEVRVFTVEIPGYAAGVLEFVTL